MKKILLKILVAIISVTLITSAFIFNVSAASATFNKSTYTVDIGEKVTITVTVKGNKMMGSDFTISYNSSYLSYVSGADDGGAGEAHIVDITMNELNTKSYKLVFKALKTGSSAISVSGVVTDGSPLSDKPISASANIKIKDAEKSTNANLKSLSLQHGTLSPSFSPKVTSYTAKVANNITSSTIFASTADSKATTEIIGSSSLKVGENVRKVIVTAQSGATKTYTITITRLDEDEEITDNKDDDEKPQNPLETVINNVTHIISTDISSVKLFNGFAEKKVEFKGEEVPVATDTQNNFTFYYLSTPTSDTLNPFTYNESDDTFTPVTFLRQGKNDYIFAEIPQEHLSYFENNFFKIVEFNINNFTIKAYNSPNATLSDFYYVYAYSDGEYSMYRYDNDEKVLQRCPDYNSNSIASPVVKETEDSNDNDFLAKFNTLKPNAKIVVIALAGALFCSVILIILLVIKLFTKVKYKDELEEDFAPVPYNNVKFNKNFTGENNDVPLENDKTE